MHRRQYEEIRTVGKLPRTLPSRESSGCLHSTHPPFFPATPLHSPMTTAPNDLSLTISALHNPGGFPRELTIPRERPEKLSSSDSKAIFMLRQADKIPPVRRAVQTSLSPLKLRPPSSFRPESLGGAVLPPIPLQVEALVTEERQEGAPSDSLGGSSDVYTDEDSDEVSGGVAGRKG